MQAVSQHKKEKANCTWVRQCKSTRVPEWQQQVAGPWQRLKTEVPWISVNHAVVSNGLYLLYNSTMLNSSIFVLISGK